MRIFVTGATGFIGSAVVQDLIGAGHQVLGLARTDAAAAALAAAGAEAHRGTVEDLDSLRSGAASSDGVIHTAFIHDFSKFNESCEIDRRAIEALGEALAGSDRPLIVTSGTGMGSAGPARLATEDHFDPYHPNPRAASEFAAEAVAQPGPAPQRLRKLVDALIEVKRRRSSDDPELFAAYMTLAADAKSVVAAHIAEMVGLAAKVIASGVKEGTFRADDPVAAGRAVLIATSKFHHPAHAAEWGDPAIDAAYDDVWQLLMNGLRPG